MSRSGHCRSVVAGGALLSWLLAGCVSVPQFVRVSEVDLGSEVPADERSASARSRIEMAWMELSPPTGRPPVLLVNMVHVGEPAYFAEVQAELDAIPVVLMEGIVREPTVESSGAATGPSPRIGADLFDIADALRLRHQVDELRFRDHWRKADMTETEFRELAPRAWVHFGPTLRDLQKDVNFEIYRFRRRRPELDPAFAAEIVRRGPARRVFADRILASTKDPRRRPVIVDARNEIALRALDECDGDRQVAICWGFAHGPGLLSGLVRRGYTVKSTSWHRAFSF